MKYRALLYDPNQTSEQRTRETAGQEISESPVHLEQWAAEVLKGRKPGARVTVYEIAERAVAVVYSAIVELPPEVKGGPPRYEKQLHRVPLTPAALRSTIPQKEGAPTA